MDLLHRVVIVATVYHAIDELVEIFLVLFVVGGGEAHVVELDRLQPRKRERPLRFLLPVEHAGGQSGEH